MKTLSLRGAKTLAVPAKAASTYRSRQSEPNDEKESISPSKQRERRQEFFLANNKGLSVVCQPNTGYISPHSEVIIGVTIYNNVGGIYADQLQVEIEGLHPNTIPVVIEVKGSPLILAPNQLGITAVTTPPNFSVGSTITGSSGIARPIRLLNTGQKPIDVRWKYFQFEDI